MKETNQGNGLSRRSFLFGAAATAGIATLGLTGCSADGASAAANHTAVGLPEAWDDEAEIVIVGYGGAGAVAAITAYDDGAESIIMIEKYPDDTDTDVLHTPSTRYAGGVIVSSEDPKLASEALYNLSFGLTPRAVCDVWGEGDVKAVDWWKQKGVDFTIYSDHGEYPEMPGNETISIPFATGGGPRLFQVLRNEMHEREDKVKYYWETTGKQLVVNHETNEVAGVVAQTKDGKEIYIKATKAVALTTGGFEWDEEMRNNFLKSSPTWFYTNPNNDGSGIRMGQAVGGALWHMNTMSARVIPYSPDWPKAMQMPQMQPNIIVNKHGERFYYEYPYPSHNVWTEFAHFDSEEAYYPADPAWIIFDDSAKKPILQPQSKGCLDDSEDVELQYWEPKELADMDVCIQKGWILKGNTPEELAAQILKDEENEGRITPEALAETITRYNGFCASGVDEDYGRGAQYLIPLSTPPYYAVKVYPGGPNTQGGLKKNEKGQVINSNDEPIKRLYCAGENGSVYGFLYPGGGGNIAELTIFGQVIGHEMVNETAWE